MRALMPRILMAAHIPPRPAVESAFLHVSDVVGDKVISQAVAFVHRTPQLASLRIDCQPASGIANSIGIHLQCAVGWVAPLNVGPIFFARRSVRIVPFRAGTY